MGNVTNAVILLNSLLATAQSIGKIVEAAQKEGRTDLTSEEWAAIDGMNKSATQQLDDAIAKASA